MGRKSREKYYRKEVGRVNQERLEFIRKNAENMPSNGGWECGYIR